MTIHQMVRKKSQIMCNIPAFYLYILNLIASNFINDEKSIASGSGTQQHMSWNTLQNSEEMLFLPDSTNDLGLADWE